MRELAAYIFVVVVVSLATTIAIKLSANNLERSYDEAYCKDLEIEFPEIEIKTVNLEIV